MNFDKEEIIKYRLERADETIAEAKLLAKDSHWNTVANRLYYACFYAVLGLLTKNDTRIKTHDGVKNILNKEFIKTDLLPKEMGKFYSNLFSKRQESDYLEMKRFTQIEIEPLIIEAEKFIRIIKGIATK
jgi:uncharacterized protein (UPF0332 family)